MKTNKIILTIAFLFTVLIISAQDKYDYAIIEYNTLTQRLNISINGAAFSHEEAELPKADRDHGNTTPLLNKITVYQDMGWEVMSFEKHGYFIGDRYNGEICSAFLRKKKTDKK
jgi:hypothetical protein